MPISCTQPIAYGEGIALAWSTEELGGKPADILTPPQPPRGIVVFLHGYDGVTLRENSTFTDHLLRRNLACVCPLGPECWWTDRIYPPYDPNFSPLQFLMDSIPASVQSRWGLSTAQIGLCGVEMGGQGVLQLAYRQARTFPLVAAISPKVDFETWHGYGTSLDSIFPDREAARQATATLHIHPLDWPRHQLLLCDPADNYCFDGVLTLASKLSSSGIPFDSDFATTYGGFGWTYANAIAEQAIDYLARHLPD